MDPWMIRRIRISGIAGVIQRDEIAETVDRVVDVARLAILPRVGWTVGPDVDPDWKGLRIRLEAGLAGMC
jgi:hypothetical protein